MAYEIELRELPVQPTVVIRATASPSKLPALFGESIGALHGYLASLGIQPAGPPFARYFEFREDSIDLEIGLPVPAAVAGLGDIEASALPAGRVALTWHIGPYEALPEAYAAIEAWIADHGLASAGPIWEVYWSDPQAEPDPAHWCTQMMQPVA